MVVMVVGCGAESVLLRSIIRRLDCAHVAVTGQDTAPRKEINIFQALMDDSKIFETYHHLPDPNSFKEASLKNKFFDAKRKRRK